MTVYRYTIPWLVIDDATGDPVRNRSDGVLFDPSGTAVPAKTLLGVATAIQTGPKGTTVDFTAEIPMGYVRFGSVETAVWADAQANALPVAEQAAAEAAAMRAQVATIAENASEVAYFYRDANGDIWISDTPVLVGGGVPRVNVDGDPVVVFTSNI